MPRMIDSKLQLADTPPRKNTVLDQAEGHLFSSLPMPLHRRWRSRRPYRDRSSDARFPNPPATATVGGGQGNSGGVAAAECWLDRRVRAPIEKTVCARLWLFLFFCYYERNK